jgi:hypothetical protein
MVVPGRGLLEAFVNLTSSGRLSPANVERFAKKWGALGICKHGKPYTHRRDGHSLLIRVPEKGDDAGTQLRGCPPLGYPRPERRFNPALWDPLESWDTYSGNARALINIAAALNQSRFGEVEDWHRLLSRTMPLERWTRTVHVKLFASPGVPKVWGSRLNAERFWISNLLNLWLEDGDVRWQCAWERPAFMVTPGVQSLFGAIALQLMLAIGRVDALAVCSNCRVAYGPRRKPVAGRRSYCETCRRDKIPQRDATAAYRERRRKSR